ncbi:MarR family transcriptional regulator [Candidatus Gracilibacteria bacterium]|nr:MarR family transcriptional regulator [Candidatus Gracilibacteria bacterium]
MNINSGFFLEVIKDRRFMDTEFSVFFRFISMIKLNNYDYLLQKELAEELNLAHQKISKLVIKLVQLGLIIKTSIQKYYLKYTFAWCGNSKILC